MEPANGRQQEYLCDQAFPRIWSASTPDHFARAIEGTTFEKIHLAQRELNWQRRETLALERAIRVRYGRTREADKSVTSAFTHENQHVIRDRGMLAEPQRLPFTQRMGRETRAPTAAKLEELGLPEVVSESQENGKAPRERHQ